MTDLERDIMKPIINDDVCLKCGKHLFIKYYLFKYYLII